jgi:nucleoside phosphorylase
VRCLAMCGVCAGKRGEVELGDVIVADRVWQYDTGKRKAETVKKKRVVREAGDIEMYRLHPPAWKQAAERFEMDRKARWLSLRPRSLQAQGDWILERLLRGADPVADAVSQKMCVDLDKALERLWTLKLLRKQKVELTAGGRKYIEQLLLVNRGRLPKPKPLRVHVGPIASGNMVMQDDEVFARLSESVRKVLGVEMEVAAIGALAYAERLPYSVVMKAVMDHADADKSDNFKSFASRASAEVLLAFLRKNVPPRGMREDPILHPGTSPMPSKVGPAALLNARHEMVPFYGRGELLEEMRVWCESEGKVRARLIFAAGGMGKTRFAIELGRQMRERRWRAGFINEGNQLSELLESEWPALAVLDYAESRPELREVLKRVAGRRGKKALRLVLLARNAGDWWTDLQSSDGAVKDLLCQEEPRELQEVTADREVTFREAVKAFAGAEHKMVPEGATPSLVDPRYERVLYVHAAALTTVEGREVKVGALMEETLDHEERFWREQLRERGHAGKRRALHKMRLAVAGLTLIGGVGSEGEAGALVDDEDMVVLLHDFYPGRDGQHVGALEPGLLGEAMVWRALSREGVGAEPYLNRVFEGADGRAIRTGFAVLGRLSEEHEEAEGWIARVLERDVNGRAMEAFTAAKTVGEWTAHAAVGKELAKALEREGTIELAERMEDELPPAGETVSLREVGSWVLGKRLAHLPEGMVEERAKLLNDLSLWQSELGQHEAALASAQEAVEIRRKLAETRPEAFLPDFAMSLNNLGILQGEFGQHEAALASTQEALNIRRKLAEGRPEVFLPDLAQSLTSLGVDQNNLGQREAALASSQEAVDIYRKLAQAQPDAFLSSVALGLNNLSVDLAALGQREAALASTQEAVDLYRKLAQAQPDAFLPDLAMSLNNLGQDQGDLGQHQAALASTQEAVDIRRKLAAARPEAFLPSLAKSLDNLGVSQSPLGQREAALASTQEAVDLFRKLAQAQPEAFLDDLAGSLHNLGYRQSALGQRAALASTQEAVDIRRKLAETQPEAFLPGLAGSLNNLSVDQRASGELEAALASAQEAVEIHRKLALVQPEAFLDELAEGLDTMAAPIAT